jgi:hypothetical protein
MKIDRAQPPPPPCEITMTFPVQEGWAIVAALKEWAERHPNAADVEMWS